MMSILCNRSTHMPNKPECQQKGLNWSISFIFGPFIGYQRLGDLLIRVLSWSSFSERGAGELLAGNTRICSRANKNNSRKRGEDTGWGGGQGQPEGPLYPEWPCMSGLFLMTLSWVGSPTVAPGRFYCLQPKMEKLYTVSKNKTRSWLWLRSWTPYCQIQT